MIFFAVIGGLIPSFFWLWFWLQEDKKKPEPKRMIFKTFALGSISIVVAYVLERALFPDPNIADKLASVASNTFSLNTLWLIGWPIVIWAFIEETVKYLAAYIGAYRSKYFDEPIDAMVYMITAALGFAAVENTLFLLKTLIDDSNNITFLFTGNLRFLGATILHTVSSAILGGALALSFYQSRFRKFLSFLIGLITATSLHALFNFFIITNNGKDIFKVLIFLWLAAVLVIFLFERVKYIINNRRIINTITNT